MHQGIAIAARIGLVCLAFVLSGCGWFGDDAPGTSPPDFEPAMRGDTMPEWDPQTLMGPNRGVVLSPDIAVTSVDPRLGPISGGQSVTVIGTFPVAASIAGAAQAYATYGVYFGVNRANFNGAFNPVLTGTAMYVITPPGDVLGPVPVFVIDAIYNPAPFNALSAGYEYVDDFSILDVDPSMGPISGGQQAAILGFFPIAQTIPSVAEANATYRVYFDGNLALFDSAFNPVITTEEMYVITPPNPTPGLVDVSVFDLSDPVNGERVLANGYEYVDNFFIIDVDPPSGPLSGGQQAAVIGFFPVASNISSAAQAYSAYRVYFDGVHAPFDATISPIITATEMYIITPRGSAPGLVDVAVFDLSDPVNGERVLTNGYEYIDDFAIIEVIPPLGPLSGGQQATVIGLFPIQANFATIDQAYSAYRVYFDGNLADFDPAFNPVITAEEMYVITPPNTTPGLVNVSVFDIINIVYAPFDTFRVLVDGYEYIGDLALTEVDPIVGFVFGMEPVTLRGIFPVTTEFSDTATIDQVGEAFTVYFDDNIAPFDPMMSPIVTAQEMYVLSPIPDDIGPVDVSVFSRANDVYVQLDNAYRYYSMLIHEVVPDSGPLSGGNDVEIRGLFLTDTIYNIYQAEQIYTTLFGANQATFVSTPVIPAITAGSIQFMDAMNQMYVSNRLYMSVPPGDALGLVDVQVISDLGREPRAIARDAYTYIADDQGAVGVWEDAIVSPNPVGKLPPGDLLVQIVVTGTIDGGTEVFITPQGADPEEPANRIILRELSNVSDDDGTRWSGTNTRTIDTRLNGDTGILMDGHAALYILDGSTDNILGTDYVEPSDGGLILENAQQGRHFIIDTIPPRMLIEFALYGSDFIDLDGDPLSDEDTTTADVASGTLTHPFPLPGSGSIGRDDVTSDDSQLRLPASLGDRRAQLFFNTGSIVNDFVQENLLFNLIATFVDRNVYQAIGDLPNPLTDTDLFTQSVDRQVAGFELNINPDEDNDDPDNVPSPPTGDVEETLISGNDVLVQWDFRGSSSGTPHMDDITTTYTSDVPDPSATAVGITLSPTNLRAAHTQLLASWVIGNPDSSNPSGLDYTGQNRVMSIAMRAVDRAGAFYSQGEDTSGDRRKLWTEDRDIPGVLNLWWLVDTGTQFTNTNIPPSENAREPNFIWENTSQPDPQTELPSNLSSDEPQRIYNYRLWSTDGTQSREDARDGPYTPVGLWNGWDETDSTNNFLTTADLQGRLNDSEGRWMLLVVIAADEAGNVEQWPIDDLQALPIGTTEVVNVISGNNSSQSNWQRWFVPPAAQVIDTQAIPTFWHNFPDSANDRRLGNIEIVPLPARNSGGTVSVEFEVEVIPETSDSSSPVSVEYELFEDGISINSDIADDGDDGQIDRRILLNFADLGDPATRRPVHYVFRATGIVSPAGSNVVRDSTPVNFSFVVVDNVVEFIENRRSTDQQPIKELDRP